MINKIKLYNQIAAAIAIILIGAGFVYRHHQKQQIIANEAKYQKIKADIKPYVAFEKVQDEHNRLLDNVDSLAQTASDELNKNIRDIRGIRTAFETSYFPNGASPQIDQNTKMQVHYSTGHGIAKEDLENNGVR
ncbi:hypothetical protein [Latilactobacillus sakei]|uniref:hypothetical protein n=1 Tax=Latilactobacillus sakei TaxID=1599 RepID=UPI003F53088F